jgi:hypothetical protein
MLRVPSDISNILGLKCAPVAQYTNILKTQACEITNNNNNNNNKKTSIIDGSNTSIYTKTDINTAESRLSYTNRSGMW